MAETRKQRAGLLRAVAYGYATMTALVGLGLLAFLAVLYAAFGLKPSDWLLVALFVIPAMVCLALAPFIWRQKGWAMIAALGLIVAACAMIGIDGSPIGWATTIVAILFAIFTGLQFWLGAARPAGN
jgi:hypothetical protein